MNCVSIKEKDIKLNEILIYSDIQARMPKAEKLDLFLCRFQISKM